VTDSDRPAEVDASSGKGVRVGDHGTQHNVFVEQRVAAAAPVALARLPPLASEFTGRQAELAQVAELLDPAAGSGMLVVSAVAGLAGVGKTALAVHTAHAAREVGWFAGGVLFIDLHGYDENPVLAGQALDALLRALGFQVSTSRKGLSSGLGCTGRSWRGSPTRC
jgi:Mrp family chromosome partitioning ATPase